MVKPLSRSHLSYATLMVQGTTSDAGKSTLVAGLCRVLARQGVSVAPFKPQNMALNSAITQEGTEIGRAQAVQAQAARLAPSHHMNPVLIKPASDTGAQIVIQGKPFRSMEAGTYHQYKPVAQQAALASYDHLKARYRSIVVEGAGSPAEINLREGDIANMGFAEAVDCPVIIIADIDKGGVFAHLVGTLALLSDTERDRVIGFVINRFRGDIALLEPGLKWLESRTQKPVLGVLPYLPNFYLASEDAIEQNQSIGDGERLNVVVPVLPRMSNHTDFDALRLHPKVNVQFVDPTQVPPACDLMILPGTKNVIADCQFLMTHQWRAHLNKHCRYGGKLLGVCGGFQMLGEQILDPNQIEGTQTALEGFGFLPLTTRLKPNKTTQHQKAECRLGECVFTINGYEIHHGVTHATAGAQSTLTRFTLMESATGFEGEIGCVDQHQAIIGTYLHGLFDDKNACDALLKWAGLAPGQALDLTQVQEQEIDRLANCLESNFSFRQLDAALEAFYQKDNRNTGAQRSPGAHAN